LSEGSQSVGTKNPVTSPAVEVRRSSRYFWDALAPESLRRLHDVSECRTMHELDSKIVVEIPS